MSDSEKVNLALLDRYSEYKHVNMPQSDPFICWGIFFAMTCFHPDKSSSACFLALCSLRK